MKHHWIFELACSCLTYLTQHTNQRSVIHILARSLVDSLQCLQYIFVVKLPVDRMKRSRIQARNEPIWVFTACNFQQIVTLRR